MMICANNWFGGVFDVFQCLFWSKFDQRFFVLNNYIEKREEKIV